MRRAVELAWEASGGVGLRPPVGAVLTQGGSIVGEGKTELRPGRHAEIAAIEDAKGDARGATLYCTLEPHSFHGNAPACTEAIIGSGITKVVCLIKDPNPMVNGNGFAQLKDAGVEVVMETDTALLRESRQLTEGFAKYIKTGLPFLSVKIAMSMDGKVAASSGDSRWITCKESRQRVHTMRARADAVLTGVGSVIADDSRLTARLSPFGASRPTIRAVADTNARLSPNARIFSEGGKVLWFTADDLSPPEVPRMAEHIPVGRKAGKLDLMEILKCLLKAGCSKVMVEAGPTMLGSFFDEGLVDKLDIFIAPMIIGGIHAPGPIGGEGCRLMSEVGRVKVVDVETVGEDMLITAYASWCAP